MSTRIRRLAVTTAVFLAGLMVAPSQGLGAITLAPDPLSDAAPGKIVKVRGSGFPDKTRITAFLNYTTTKQVKPVEVSVERSPDSTVLDLTIPPSVPTGRYQLEVRISPEGAQTMQFIRDLRVLPVAPPKLTRIHPAASYPRQGTFNFEILGDNFSEDPRDSVVAINGRPISFERDAAKCQPGGPPPTHPCLSAEPTKLTITGFSPQGDGDYTRPMRLSVYFLGAATSDASIPLTLSLVDAATPQAAALLFFLLISAVVLALAWDRAHRYEPVEGARYNVLQFLLIDSQTNTYSLSKFQLLLWTAAAVLGYSFLAFSQFLVQGNLVLPDVPTGLPTLLGISVGTTALAIGVTEARGSKGAGPAHPALGDLITTGGVLAADRLQFFIWTVVGVLGFLEILRESDPATLTQLPKIPENFWQLMGISAAGYLAGKALRKPGPVVKSVAVAAAGPPVILTVRGENLSPQGSIRLENQAVANATIARSAGQSTTIEFVESVDVTIPALPAAPAGGGKRTFGFVNPDGQSADFMFGP